MEEKKLVPKLRFPGFTEPWEQRKLGEIVSAYSGGTPSASNKEYYGGDIPFIRSAEINNNHTELYITQKGLKDSSAKLVEKGTILYAMYGATSGEVSISQIDGAINQAILAMVPLMYDGEFIAQYLRRQKKNIINKYLQGGQGNLSANIVLNLQIQLPGVDEANQITSFFVKLDNLITLHQRKLEHLKLKKKSLLQKLFPKEGEVYPELRFPGFTAPWEQRKLGEIVERVTRKNNGQSDRPLTISAQDGLVDQCEYFDRQVASRDMSNYYLIKKGEFAYNKSYSDGYPFGAIKRLDYYDKGALSTLYIIFKIVDDRIGSDFMVAYYMTSLWYKEISKRAAEGARNHGLLNISTEDFFNSELKIPNDIKEQIKVGKFVNQFDQYITLHQRKLEHLQLLKKALLQQLFV